MSVEKSFLGHPRGLATLFFTEMWERFSYYGMRALLVLYMTAKLQEGGMGLDDKTGTAIYGLYGMFVYLLAIPGGWLADRLFGLRKAVFYGGTLIALGHICMAIPINETFFLGLLLIVLGTGLLKPNISSMVGELYPDTDQTRRDAGFSIFYMGINLGATIAPIVTGYLRFNYGWHFGFGAAAVGMIIGLIQYKLTMNYLGKAGLDIVQLEDPAMETKRRRKIMMVLTVLGALLAAFVVALMLGVISINPVALAQGSALIILVSISLFFLYIFLFVELEKAERNKIIVIGILFIFSGIFWAGYEQQGSTLNMFADRYTQRVFGDWEMPTEWFQSVPAVFVVIFSGVFAMFWTWLGKRNMAPNTPSKFSWGLLLMGAGYAVMMGAGFVVASGKLASPSWLVITYLLHTFGELCLSPVGLSAVTKLSPKRLVGQMMGVWFMSIAFGNLMAGLFAGEFDEEAIATTPSLLPDLFWKVVVVMLISGGILMLLNKPIRKLMGNIR